MGAKKGQKPTNNVASCIVAAIFLAFIIIILLILFFSVFKAKDPRISVNYVQVPSFQVSNYPDLLHSQVNFSMTLYFSVKNPNKATFKFYDSSVQLLYYGNQIGLMFIPADKIRAGKTGMVCATLMVQPFPFLLYPEFMTQANYTRILPVESRIKMAGRVRVLYFFTHRVEASAACNNNIAVIDGAVLSFQC